MFVAPLVINHAENINNSKELINFKVTSFSTGPSISSCIAMLFVLYQNVITKIKESKRTKEVFMEKGNVYKVDLSQMSTSNYFKKNHKIRIEISSSNFPRFARNLNTGGDNFNEFKGIIARNTIHHSKKHPSSITLPIVKQ